MEKQVILHLTHNFEESAHQTEDGIEFWLARDLQSLLGYDTWRRFENVIERAKIACEQSGQDVLNHFAGAGKMVNLGSGAEKEIDDYMLTRYACYLIAQNGDPRKPEIAFAQTYFAVQTRKAEIIEQKMLEFERIQARHKLKETEKELSKVIFQQTGGDESFAMIRSKGDQALFKHSTQQMKNKWGIKNNQPLADFMPTILLKAKDFAAEITIYNTKNNNLTTENKISQEHITNNQSVRDTLISRGITPENLPPEDDINKLERKLQTESKKLLGNFTKKRINDEPV